MACGKCRLAASTICEFGVRKTVVTIMRGDLLPDILTMFSCGFFRLAVVDGAAGGGQGLANGIGSPPIIRATSYSHSASRFQKAITIKFGSVRPVFPIAATRRDISS